MVLESTILCVDNSEYMRNGDFVPTRLQAQQDAVNLIAHSKTRANPENNVGLLTMANSEVLVTLTTDTGKILARLHQVQPNGEMRFLTGIRIAHLALKHRQGKNHRMRIICFVGSPLDADEAALNKLAKRLKKEKVNVDIINFGEENANTELLSGFISSVNGKDGTASHLVNIPTGPHLSDALVTSPIVIGEGGSGAPPPGYEFGVDPNEDPELALALRVSMEEQRQRQEEEARNTTTEEAPVEPPRTEGDGSSASSEEVLLRQALALSMDQSTTTDEAKPIAKEKTEKKPASIQSIPDFSSMTEEEQIAYAMQISMQADEEEATGKSEDEEPMEVDQSEKDDEDFSEALTDPEFLANVLEGLPGVDPQSEEVKKSMEKLKSSSDKDGKKKEKAAGEKKEDKSTKREGKQETDKNKKSKTDDKKSDGDATK